MYNIKNGCGKCHGFHDYTSRAPKIISFNFFGIILISVDYVISVLAEVDWSAENETVNNSNNNNNE